VATGTVNSACQLIESPPTLVPDAASPASRASQTLHAQYILRDPLGILLNELETTLNWTFNTTVLSHSVSDYHQVAGDGWDVVYDHTYTVGGCNGCSYVTVEGSAEFYWVPSGGVYDNYNQNYVTGYWNGSGGCTFRWQWDTGFPGWTTHTSCTYG
jgi:hypothetical protein